MASVFACSRAWVEVVAGQHDLGAEALGALDLHGRRMARHHDDGRDAELLRVVRQSLRMVAGRHGDHAAACARSAASSCSSRVQRAALLERGGELQVLELDPHLRTDDRRQRARMQARRALDAPGEPRGRGPDVVDRDRAVLAVLPGLAVRDGRGARRAGGGGRVGDGGGRGAEGGVHRPILGGCARPGQSTADEPSRIRAGRRVARAPPARRRARRCAPAVSRASLAPVPTTRYTGRLSRVRPSVRFHISPAVAPPGMKRQARRPIEAAGVNKSS